MDSRRLLVTLVVFITILGTPSVRCDPSPGFDCVISQDTLRPEIYAWGVDGNPSLDDSYSVWANVSDTGSGVQNVSLIVKQLNGNTSTYLLESNGSHYIRTMPGLAANHTYTLYIIAFDNAGNSATSYSRTYDTHPLPPPSVDPVITMPWVVGTSIGLGVVVLLISILYARYRGSKDNV